MSKQWVVLAAGAMLASCGGGGDGGSSLDTSGTDAPATLSAPSDAAKAASALLDFISLSGGFGIRGGSVKALKASSPPCDTGDKFFTGDGSTVYANDGQTVFSQCTQVEGSNQFVEDGVRTTKCTDPNQTATQCAKEASFAGLHHEPLRLELVGQGTDRRVLALGNAIESTNGDRYADGIEQHDNLISHQSATLVFDKMFLFTSAPSGDRTARIAGGYGLSDMARATANCLSGRLTVSTPTDTDSSNALAIDTNEDVVGGHLHFASDNGDVGDVTFHSDHTVSASVNNGTPQTFSADQFRQFCSIQ